ncbi:MAG: sigma-70 family RNA polymerase sigma factor [Bacteroidetes bacterium]|nr:sigma-70 family RNA polymerase sigma factor [Rhodothermia bacterium]MCS7155103.1 sigma-70 family RNA polymerase sigma factor [Bacteroidota bacterium]MCX7907209.1 sigma-70 family RNA polymerase sigma factor [Bacteroidota bacterium]MDW8138720.1 sigma-70 family RNA polymerase sigma factor [Bacteroidota bacterium]MDW8286055.1 sigma-70 family RNA polymerase sigma factor [Bacteroidota bacterium]
MERRPEHEAKLLERLRAGDCRAFRELVEAYQDRLYDLLYRMLRNRAEAEDALQEVFLQAYRGLPRFDGRSSLYTWLYRIATNVALMRLRRFRPSLISLEDPPEAAAQEIQASLQTNATNPLAQVLADELREQLDRWLEELPPLTRLVFLLRDVEDLPIGEVAALTGQTEWAAKGRLKRARAHVRNRLVAYMREQGR